ncbi:hypothetical protein PHACT_11980 [Pseudohongiella acticola]|jgi:small RNA 2'-O-methyltransferase|uniref:Small RNA 2'-O-methyltransferase n=1 Tax=Pseudohongiella acticola TaxID=1524254 RepID=A0A1E8CMX5_9GAMM|nr:methyltransferase domain-containing protein [Pseudohongiella acticola]OFE13763.1 hypothetical protein PHACT_11980 [Pseudohongiella acticola]
MSTDLHRERLDAVLHEIRGSEARCVVDLGCGNGELLVWLRELDQITRLIGIDIDTTVLAEARQALNIDMFNPSAELKVCRGSFENTDWYSKGGDGSIDAAIMLETIEHIEPGRLSRVEDTVFRALRPPLVIITTPNKEYNPIHGMADHEIRHPGHFFEWTRAQFRSWCEGVAGRHRYTARYADIGETHPTLGSSTQMVCFESDQ